MDDDAINAGDPMFPVAAITTLALPTLPAVLIRLDFLTGPMQPPDRPNQGRNYCLTPGQAQELARQILGRLHALQSAGTPPAPGSAH